MEVKGSLPPGTRIEEFEFRRVLGHGGFGLTYLGWDHSLEISVAIKEYLPVDLAFRESDFSVGPRTSHARDEFNWGLDRFLAEARALARFSHPSLVRVYRFFNAHGTGYIVMEYVEGETLSDYLERVGHVDEATLRGLLTPILDGLEQVHRGDFLHRDIKPGNIIIREDSSPVLIDFGAARNAMGQKSRSVTSIVTPGYAPIEQYSTRGNQGPWTDIYGLGAVCYRALTGDAPMGATDRLRVDPLVPATEAARERGSPAFLQAIDRALAVEEENRPQSISEWRRMFETGAGRSASRQATAAGETAWSRDRRVQAAAITAVALLLAGAGYWVLRPQASGPAAAGAGSAEAGAGVESDTADNYVAGDVFRDCPQCPELVVVPGGDFLMGSPTNERGRATDEGPRHPVKVEPFAIGRFEVTFAEWDACVEAGGCTHSPDDEGWGRGTRPVMNVSWEDVTAEYLPWLSRTTGREYRLPGEAEQEYVLRAGEQSRFPWGEREAAGCEHANGGRVAGCDDGHGFTSPVGSLRANAFGLHDTSGNVWEWSADCWREDYSEKNRGAPDEPAECSKRVLRGGSWDSAAVQLRSAERFWDAPAYRFSVTGFRVARNLSP